MSVELLQTLSLALYIVAGVLFLVGIVLFFLLDVPKLYGDVSGRTAKKAIEAIRQQNESTGNKAYKPSAVNAERGKLTDKITQSGRLQSQTSGLPVSVGTEKLDTSTLMPQSNETTVLAEAANETTVLEQSAGETTVLTGTISLAGETTVLVNNEAPSSGTVADPTKFIVDVEMSFTGSSEIIE
jgi:hypothetical protein